MSRHVMLRLRSNAGEWRPVRIHVDALVYYEPVIFTDGVPGAKGYIDVLGNVWFAHTVEQIDEILAKALR